MLSGMQHSDNGIEISLEDSGQKSIVRRILGRYPTEMSTELHQIYDSLNEK
jgi:hypothetical protein